MSTIDADHVTAQGRTVDAMRAMAAAAGFAIVDEAPVEPEELSHCLLLRPPIA